MTEDAMEDHELWLFDLAHGNLTELQILQGFIRYYVLEGHMLSRVQDDLVYRTRYGCYYAGQAMEQLKAVLKKTAEGGEQ
ncbi:MAG: hypothetical protein NC123_18950 [Butyrivibrio sp.]|nr:hypothetical protein [Acetatifactor muris]MCM1561591.1 hypothetical protein [Butyrivibrio sp.]